MSCSCAGSSVTSPAYKLTRLRLHCSSGGVSNARSIRPGRVASAGSITSARSLAARWYPRRHDRALADGTPPEASATLALRAQRLTEPEQRRSIAQALRHILRDARQGRRAAFGRVMPSQARVTAAPKS
jgi:hypothetical protein